MTKEELEIAKAACCVGTIWDAYSGKENFDHMVGLRVNHLIELVRKYQPSLPPLPSDLDEAAIPELEMDEWMKYGPHTNYPWCGIPDAIKITAEHFFALGKQAGAEWMAGQGVSMLGRVGIYGVDVESITKELREAGFNLGEEIILQIRKKQ